MPLVNPLTIVYIAPQTTANQGTIPFALEGDATLQPATVGTGGWQIVDRPRQFAATQWYDKPPWQLDMTLLLTSEVVYGTIDASIEELCRQIETWAEPIPQTLQPPVLKINGPLPATDRTWIMYSLNEQEAVRDPISSLRVQQRMKFTFYEYTPPLSSLDPTNANPQFSPAGQAAQQIASQVVASTPIGNFAPSTNSYVVKAGDTLQSIATVQLGNYQLWSVIAALNNIRDPGSIVVGQILQLPNQITR